VEVKKTGKDSFLSQVIDLVRQAQESKSRTQNLSDRVAFWLTIIALTVGVATFLGWSIIARQSVTFALERAVTVMVIACPHALGLAVPLVVAVSTAIAAKNGLLIRNRSAFENARHIDAIILDKTGTLTEGRFGVTDVVSFDGPYSEDSPRNRNSPSPDRIGNNENGYNEVAGKKNNSNEIAGSKSDSKETVGKKSGSDILKYAASVESYSEHPIAKGITEATKERFPATDFKNITGEGAQAAIKTDDTSVNIKIVSPAYLRKHNISLDDESNSEIERLSYQGKTVVVLLVNDVSTGAIALADIIRPESKQAINSLKNMGVRSIMMTGDNKQVAEWVSEELGIDEFFAEVLPQQKAENVKDVQSRGLVVAMAGDGVNDAPALAQADVGIAIGSGTDVAVETADIVLVRSNPQDVVSIIKLARSTYAKMIQNLAWATGYNTFAIPLATGIFYSYGILLSPALGAVLMSVSTIIVAFNAKLLRLER
jgi:Cu2+-exporting ATPase